MSEGVLEQVFPGKTEMAQRMRALDWKSTPLGPVDTWSQALRTSVSTCLDCAFGIVLWWGPDLAILYNDEYRPILGGKHPTALGEPGAKVWAEIWDVIAPMLSQVMASGEATRSRDLLLHIDRTGYPEEAYFSFSYSPIRDDDGQIGGIFCPVIETTEKVIGERRLRTLRDLAAKTKGAADESTAYQMAAQVIAGNPYDIPFAMIYRVGDDGSFASLEAAAGIAHDASAAPHRVAFTGAAMSGVWSLASVAHTGAPTLTQNISGDFGSLPSGAWTVAPQSALVLPVLLPGQERPRAILVAAVSPMRALDDDYRTFFELVATQIASALADAQALQEERRRAEALAEIDRAKTAFFSNVSHEFRTPLTLMLGPLEDALASAYGSLPPDAAEALDVAHRNSLRLLKLVNTLLDFSRIEAGRVDASYEPTDLAAFTGELASVFRSTVEKAGLRLVVDCAPLPEPAFVDRDMWEKVVLNLISNAFKFTFDGSISVSLRQEGDRILLAVSDTGVGIPKTDIPKLFQRFHRVRNARSRTHEGTGIGLALVQELAKLHGGDVSAESEEGLGSTFIVTIPAGKAHVPADQIGVPHKLASTHVGATPFVDEALRTLSAGDSAPAHDVYYGTVQSGTTGSLPVARARIVLADDNADMRDYLHRLLARDHDVVAVPDGQAALDCIQSEMPDLVVADVMMPGLDGFGLVAAIRGDTRTRTLPVIMLSARAGEESRIEGLAAGADDYLIKPFSARELLARVASQLQMARIRSEAAAAIRHRSAQFETLFNQAPLGVFLLDAGLRVREVNPIARPIFGDAAATMIGQTLRDVMRKLLARPYADEVVRLVQHTLDTGEPVLEPERAEFRIDRGVTEYYEWRSDRITLSDGTPGVVCYLRDVSVAVAARKIVEQGREALRETDRRKDEFLATLAHELRTPLAPIRNALHLLRESGRGGEAASAVYDMMERQISHMVRLVDDLMEVSRITRGRIGLIVAPADIGAIVQGAVETTMPLIDAGGHTLTVTLPPEPLTISVDAARLGQVLANLLNNAAKYTENGGHIWLTVAHEGANIAVSVRDDGVGITGDALPRVFDVFMQADRTYSRAQGGLGIGLTLARSLVELHGGTIEALSDGAGCGSEFIIRLPESASPVATPKPVGTASSAAPIAGRRILVVDDNRDAADSLAMVLRYLGAEVHVAHDGPAALDAVRTFRPAVALLDIGMPGMDGCEVARRTRLTPEGGVMKLIALTGWGQAEDHRRSKEAGIDHHLTKPVDLYALERLITTLDIPGDLTVGREAVAPPAANPPS